MPSSTPVHAYPYPVSGDPFNVPADMQALANALDAGTPVVSATAPTSPPAGLLWYQPAGAGAAALQIWDGSQWQPLVPGADTGWVNITLASGYKPANSFTPQYRVKNGDVVFRGQVAPTSGTFSASTVTLSTAFPNPPSGAYAMATCATDNSSNPARVYMTSSGTLFAGFGTNGAAYVDLSALRYPLG